MNIFVLAAFVAVLMVIWYRRETMQRAMYALIAVAVVGLILPTSGVINVLLVLAAVISALLAYTPFRQERLSKPIFKWFKGVLPELSPTEQEAIDAGTVWWDGELFSGKPNWTRLLDIPKPEITPEGQAFLDGPVTELCRMTDAWKINHDWNQIPEPIINYVKSNKFFGMIIPKEYGGLDLTAVEQSEVLSRLANTGGGVNYLVGVPNSLGPGELLIKYGTPEQQKYYLPRLANGEEIPCFALTGPTAGSDATSIPDTGVVCKGEWEGEEVLGMRLNFNKRYITLAPIATLVGLAFNLRDPDGLIGDIKDYGITCALLPRDTQGMTIGRRHLPVGDAFLNGPIQGENVFVPLSFIIGGQENAGKGWRMLVNCLSVGRCITLPSSGNAACKRMLMGTSAYATLRKQFGLPISMFEGVQKPLARMTGYAYIVSAARLHTAQALEFGEKPSVASAILKYHCTEMARQSVIDAMDIHGGKAIIKGPKNYVSSAYESIPVGITVEGANILTRNLMIFGQGATRSHPYVLREMELAASADMNEALPEFDDVFFKHVGFSLSNASRALIMGLTGSKFAGGDEGHVSVQQYYRHLNRLSAAFALIADVSMLSLQSKLKFKEMLSARLGDLLSNLYLASMVLKQYENEGCPKEELPVVRWSLDYLLNRYQVAMCEILDNYPNRVLALTLRTLIFPLGAHFKAPADSLDTEIVRLMTSASEVRERMVSGTFDEVLPNNPLGHVNAVFKQSLQLQPVYKRIRQAIKDKTLPKLQGVKLLQLAHEHAVITAAELSELTAFEASTMDVIHVDDFADEDLIRKPYSEDDF